MTNDKTKILALDLSTVSTGYAFRDSEQVIHHGAIVPQKGHKIPLARISDISVALAALVARLQPECLAIESPIIGKTAAGSITICMLHGLIRIAAYRDHRPVFDYHPSTLKKRFTGDGRADKLKMIAEAERITGEVIKTSDEADAIALLVTREEDEKSLAEKKGFPQ